MAVLLAGDMPRLPYCALLRNLHPIYQALEPALERHAAHPAVAPVVDPALWRTAPLGEDLDVLMGPRWGDLQAMQAVTADYVRRLQLIDATRPALLLAHAYVRFLGDLSGGQMLRRIVGKSLQLANGTGTSFYDFGPVEVMRAMTLKFREGLSGIVLDRAEEDAVVAEAVLAFELHRQLFDALADDHGVAPRAAGRP